jgi:hypothetical protein
MAYGGRCAPVLLFVTIAEQIMPRFRALVGCSGAILVMPHNRSQAFINANERLLALTNVYARLKFAGMMIGICSHKDGVGKTATAVYFAAIMPSQCQNGV